MVPTAGGGEVGLGGVVGAVVGALVGGEVGEVEEEAGGADGCRVSAAIARPPPMSTAAPPAMPVKTTRREMAPDGADREEGTFFEADEACDDKG